jgi:ribonuclease HII
MTEKRREVLFLEIKENAIAYGIGIVSPERIDEINILQATYEAMRMAIEEMEKNFSITPSLLLNDAVRIPLVDIPQVPIVHGDAKSLSIAAASVLAKVSRDHLMLDYAKEFPEYGFEKHKGYGTKAHTEAILEHGPCPIHRRSFLKKLYAGK